MKKSGTSFIWGIVLIIVGILFAGREFGVFEFSLFFKGWWTLFIIVPCFIQLFGEENKSGPIVGIVIGLMLLFSQQDFIPWYIWKRLFVPIVLVLIGLKLLLNGSSQKYIGDKNYSSHSSSENRTNYDNFNQENYRQDNDNQDGSSQGNYTKEDLNQTEKEETHRYQTNTTNGGYKNYTALLSGKDVRIVNEIFEGANVTAILGGIELDLKNAIIEKDVRIEVSTILGGIDIYVPQNVKVVVDCNSILAGVDNCVLSPVQENLATIYIYGTCILGGIDIK